MHDQGPDSRSGAESPQPFRPGRRQPASRRFITELAPQASVDQVFLATQKQLRPNRNGQLYLQIELADRSGSITGRMWNASDEDFAAFDEGDYVRVEGTTQLTPDSQPTLDALRKVVTPTSDVQITGHTDTTGDAASNDKLSLDRAIQVRAALVEQGLPVANAKVTGRGERDLRVPTGQGVSEPANRRVEVIIR